MKAFYVILFCGVLLVAWKSKSSSSGDDSASLRQRELVKEVSFIKYPGTPSPTTKSKCGLINALVNETCTVQSEQTWLRDSDIPHRVMRFYTEGYDKVFVCGNACGKSESDPSSSYRYMGCTLADASGVLANPAVLNWTNKTSDTTITNTLSDRMHDALEETIAHLPSSIEGMDLLDTCEVLEKKLVFFTHEYEELLDIALIESGIKTKVANKGYTLDAISHWTTNSFVGTYLYN